VATAGRVLAPTTHKAFGIHFLTFMVTSTVMCSGLTSASSASEAFASTFAEAFDLSLGRALRSPCWRWPSSPSSGSWTSVA
jgi:hypothetical protein